jgi:uroporphyrinogen-III synthase
VTAFTPGTGSLSGLRVAVTRSPDRSAALVRALRDAGAEPVLVPLIDFETAPDQGALSAAMAGLAAGEYGWLVVSSITTVRALKQWCAERRTPLAELIPSATRVATIGPSSRKVLEAEGLAVQLAPLKVQSAAGLVELWPMGQGPVLLPQSDIAESTLVSGLGAKGSDVRAVTAYRTVDYPARPDRRLTAVLETSREWEHTPTRGQAGADPGAAEPGTVAPEPDRLTPAEAREQVRAGRIDAVVAASGSAARSIARLLGPLPESCLLIAIGVPTREESTRLGLRVAATAKQPTPDGIVDALAQARAGSGAGPDVPTAIPSKESS